ncbi:MAG: beta-ketoacyl synthase N-terminal-like domain-containing protein [Pseudonocardiaceae bacterium]
MTETPATARTPDALADTDIAVVGMAGRFPDAPDLDRFWTNLTIGLLEGWWYFDDDLRDRR